MTVSYGDGDNEEGGIGSDDDDNSGDIMVLMMVIVMITKCVIVKNVCFLKLKSSSQNLFSLF